MIRTQPSKPLHHEEVPIGEAAWEVVQAGQRVLVDRIELALLELRQLLTKLEQQIFLAVIALVVMSTAWVALNWTAVVGLSEYVSRVAAGSIIAVTNAVLAVAMLLWARHAGESGIS
jgi:hypothetical protein